MIDTALVHLHMRAVSWICYRMVSFYWFSKYEKS